MNDFMLILMTEKGNLAPLTFFKSFLPPIYRPNKILPPGFGLLLLNFGINKGYQGENRS